MSLIINIENYEAFYLDFLEGNLSVEETKTFEEFLAQNPELSIDETILDFKFNSDDNLDSKFINELKVFDRTETIHVSNVNLFLIAKTEGILSATKEIELKDFLGKHNEFQKDEMLFSKTIVKPNLKEVYSAKNKLKRGFVIPMYGKFVSMAAAVALIVLTLNWNSQTEIDLNKNPFLQAKFSPKEINKVVESIEVSALKNKKEKTQTEKTEQIQVVENKTYTAFNLPRKEIKNVSSSLKKYELEELKLNPVLAVVAASESSEFDNSYLAFDKMKNPIPLVTNTFSDRLKTEIDFRSAKATKDKQGGFFLKIGKFQISNKKSAEDNLALN